MVEKLVCSHNIGNHAISSIPECQVGCEFLRTAHSCRDLKNFRPSNIKGFKLSHGRNYIKMCMNNAIIRQDASNYTIRRCTHERLLHDVPNFTSVYNIIWHIRRCSDQIERFVI